MASIKTTPPAGEVQQSIGLRRLEPDPFRSSLTGTIKRRSLIRHCVIGTRVPAIGHVRHRSEECLAKKALMMGTSASMRRPSSSGNLALVNSHGCAA